MKRLMLTIILPALAFVAQGEASEEKAAPMSYQQQLKRLKAVARTIRKQERTRDGLLYATNDPSKNVTKRDFTPNNDASLLEQLQETQEEASALKSANAALTAQATGIKLRKAAATARELRARDSMKKELANRVAVIHEEQLREPNGEPVTLYTPNPELSLPQQLAAAHAYDPFTNSLIKALDAIAANKMPSENRTKPGMGNGKRKR